MHIEMIEQLIAILERSHLEELEYAESGERVRLVRHFSDKASSGTSSPISTDVSVPLSVETEINAALAMEPLNCVMKAGMVGVFYRASGPDKPPFVEVGDTVAEGQTLAILEAMKMLNPIESDVAGRVVQILEVDGNSVEAGAPLFIIEPLVKSI